MSVTYTDSKQGAVPDNMGTHINTHTHTQGLTLGYTYIYPMPEFPT